jgi:hypothetical protein
MKLGLRFGEPDFWKILDWPSSLFEYWRAFYGLEPWDMETRVAMAESKYKPPQYQYGPRKRQRLSGAEY